MMRRVQEEPHTLANAARIYRRLFVYIRRHIWLVAIAMLASMLYSGIDAWFVYFLKPLINRGLVARDQHFLRLAPLMVPVLVSADAIGPPSLSPRPVSGPAVRFKNENV